MSEGSNDGSGPSGMVGPASGPAAFRIDPDAVRAIAGNLGGILMQAIAVSRDLERLVVPPAVYARIGDPVAAGSSVLRDGQVQAMQSVMRVLSDISTEISAVSAATSELDHDIAGDLDRLPGSAGRPSSLWGSAAAGHLAGTAMAGGSHLSAGAAVDPVLDTLARSGMGRLAEHPVPPGQFDTPRALADWLDADPDNQTRLGVIGVYAGDTGKLSDVPGGLHPGDLVYVDRRQLSGTSLSPAAQASLGVVGDDGRIYNQGAIDTADWTGVTDLRVYRPIGAR